MGIVIFLKNYFAATTQGTDCIPIIHDVRFAIRDSQAAEGLVTITIPAEEASLLIARAMPKTFDGHAERSLSIPFKNGELILDPKQMIYLIDKSPSGKRREFFVQVMGETAPEPEAREPRARGSQRRRR